MSYLRRFLRNEYTFFSIYLIIIKKRIAVFYFGFITISLLLLFKMLGLSKVTNQLTKDITLGIFILITLGTAFLLILMAMPSF